ncbi:MAG TPA: hypothetical protein VL326_18475, partial [Kofleriaceae bacterium]|nr:hypothetical protein [Kofleriaceae bacterium]
FADWTKTGKDMQVATLQADGLDAFAPQTAGRLDVGTVTVASDGFAHGTVDWLDLVDALGLDTETAVFMGRTDGLALRYANPDIDNDGTIDAYQHGHDYQLELAGAYKLATDGHEATISDLVAGTFAKPELRYTATSIETVVPRAMNMNMASGTLTFDTAFYGTALGADTPMIAPGTPIGAPHVKVGELAGAPMMGVVARAGADVPRGTYEVGFDNGQLTFSSVLVPSAPTLESARDYAVPFVHIRPLETGCKSDCDIAAIDIDWRTRTQAGWVQASAPETARLDVVTKYSGKSTYLTANLEGTSLAWQDMPVAHTGILASELAYISTSEICYLAISYPTALGMKMTMSAVNPSCY